MRITRQHAATWPACERCGKPCACPDVKGKHLHLDGDDRDLHVCSSCPLRAWTRRAIDEFQIAGFRCTEYEGLPLVILRPPVGMRTFAFLEFEPTFYCEKRIYKEGVLIIPGNPTS